MALPRQIRHPHLIALAAKGRVVGPKGERIVAAEEFCSGPGRTVLEPGELLVEVLIESPARHSSDAYLRFIPRNEMDIAVVGVGAALTLDLDEDRCVDARIGLGAVGPTPIFAKEASQALVGKKLDEAAIERAAQLAISVATPIDDMRGTAEYRRHIVGVLTRRVAGQGGGTGPDDGSEPLISGSEGLHRGTKRQEHGKENCSRNDDKRRNSRISL